MRTMANNKMKLAAHRGLLTPVQQSKLDKEKINSRPWTAVWAGDADGNRFEVQCHDTRVDVKLHEGTCTCRLWQLTGMPCKHAIAAIAHKHDRPENYCNGWLTTGAYNATYEFYVQPTQSQEFWEATPYLKPVPPPMKRKPGRPKKCRRRDSTEATTAGGTRLRRTYTDIQCSRCGGVNHNTRGCMNIGCPVMPTGWVPPPPEENEGNQTEIDLSQNAPPEENLSQPIPQPVSENAANPAPSSEVKSCSIISLVLVSTP